MPNFSLQQAHFFTTVNHLADLPRHLLPEVAFVGRSNAGKSSAINTLCNQRRLAFTSKTPGRTQHINYFCIGENKQPSAFLVDLPGYGFAAVPLEVKAHWQTLVSQYLQTRANLKGLILLVDSRRPPSELDQRLIQWFLPTAKPIHILLTKADKLTYQQSIETLSAAQRFAQSINDPNNNANVDGSNNVNSKNAKITVQLFSTLKRTGLSEANHQIQQWLNDSA